MEEIEKTTEQKALELASLMEDGKGQNVVVLDVSQLNSWTDFFIIVTVTSSAQRQGLEKSVKEYISKNDMQVHETIRKTPQGDEWNLIDLGNVVIHLMSNAARNFYELEKLWHAGKKLK